MRRNSLRTLACACNVVDGSLQTTNEPEVSAGRPQWGPESTPVVSNETQANVSQPQRGPEPVPNVSTKPKVDVKRLQEDPKKDLSLVPTDVAPAVTTGGSPDQVIKELQDEVKYLNVVIDKLEAERNALSLRLQEVHYFDKFNVAACKKWLLANYEFDRKDTPDLLTSIIENCMLQNDQVDVLPHQLLIKNSLKAQKRRERDALKKKQQARSHKRQRIDTGVADVSSIAITKTTPQKLPASNSMTTEPETLKFEGEGNHYIPLREIDELYDAEPWQFLINLTTQSHPEQQQQRPSSAASTSSTKSSSRRNSSSPTKSSTTTTTITLTEEEKLFIQKHAMAMWERTHWFPLKRATGKNEDENRLIKWHHNRRKRRQARLKQDFDKALEENNNGNSIFTSKTYDKILLQKPRNWFPLEKSGHTLLEQLVQLDQAEPDRLDCL